MVALSAYGPEIVVGADASSVGFGQAPLPAGATTTPPAAFTPPAQFAPVAAAPAPMPTPNPAFLQPPVPGAPPVAPVAPARVMLPPAQGATYEAMIAAGWTDALLVAHGMMQG